jgi:predicted CXXCH cytochrome family protein
MYVQSVFAEASEGTLNVHQTFEEKSCTACHLPHAGPYRYMLKQDPDYYLRGGTPDSTTIEAPKEEGEEVMKIMEEEKLFLEGE